jgi:ferredoxin
MLWRRLGFHGGYRFHGYGEGPDPRILPWKGSSPDSASGEKLVRDYVQGLEDRLDKPSVEGLKNSPLLIWSVDTSPWPRPFSLDFPSGGYRIEAALTRLKERFPQRGIILLLGKQERKAFTTLFPGGLPKEGIEYVYIDNRYPAHLPVLIKRVLFGGTAGNDGGGMAALHEVTALFGDEDLRWNLLALAGPGFRERGYLRIPAGASWGEIAAPYLKEGGWRLVEEDPLQGRWIKDLAEPAGLRVRRVIALEEGPREEAFSWLAPGVDRDSRFRFVLSSLFPGKKRLVTSLQGEERACFSCGSCSSCCPVSLYPQRLFHLITSGAAVEELIRFGLERCIDCGLCTCLCPAKIDLSAALSEGAARIREHSDEV